MKIQYEKAPVFNLLRAPLPSSSRVHKGNRLPRGSRPSYQSDEPQPPQNTERPNKTMIHHETPYKTKTQQKHHTKQ